MKQVRILLTVAVASCAATSLGCSAEVLTTINQVLKGAKTTAGSVKQAQAPAAAIATGLGALELLKALSGNAKGGLVAQGSGNMAPRFKIMADEGQTLMVDNPTTKVKLKVVYSSHKEANGALVSSLDSVDGQTNGYDLKAQGSFTYTPGKSVGSIACSMTGAVKYESLALTIKKLEFATTDPLPEKNAELGAFRFEQASGGKVDYYLDAKLSINDKGKIQASGTSKSGDEKEQAVLFDQDKPVSN